MNDANAFRPGIDRPSPSRRATRRFPEWLGASLLAAATILAACGGRSPSLAPTSPSPSSPSPTSGDAIAHPTGPTDVILREEVGGGFVPIWFFATQAPFFSLYGDGTVIYRDETAPLPEPEPDGVVRGHPFKIAKLTEEQVQELLRFALTDGGLAAARPNYEAGNVADAPTTVFVIRAAGLDKTVSVYALGIDVLGSADAPARAAFVRLDERLRSLITSGSLGGSIWVSDRWRGTLAEGGAAGQARAWPWPDVSPADFVADPASGLPLARRTMSSAEVAALGLDGIEGGFHSLLLEGPDGKPYLLGLRPLLPDETG